jgi:hypothetical protein
LQRSTVPQKLFNPPRSELTQEGEAHGVRKILFNYSV